MTNEQAGKILNIIMQGIDPVTGEILAEDHFCNQSDILRALHLSIAALSKEQKEERPVKLNAGRPWTDEDCMALRKL